jgi:hypothetical protein
LTVEHSLRQTHPRKSQTSDGELRSPQWQAPLQELILEFDPETLPEKIQQVKALILERRQQLDHENGGRVEKIVLHDALAITKLSSSMLD